MNDLSRNVLVYAFSFFSPEKRHSIAEELCEGKAECMPGDMLYAIRKRYGVFASIYTDTLLFGMCFIICLLTDLVPSSGNIWWKIPALISCIFSFCLCKDQLYRAFLKLAFIFASLNCEFYWSVTALFLLIFEHMTSGRQLSGKEH